jgi:hypothetical protein
VNDRSYAELAFAQIGESLTAALVAAIPAWVEAVARARSSESIDRDELADVADEIIESVEARMATLIAADIDEPLSGPLEIVRQSAEPLSRFLANAGANPPERDPYDIAARPDDRFAIGPMTFLELGQPVHEAGIEWGAAKAFVHRSRRVAHPEA